MFVVVVGNPFDGMSIYGPFDSSDEAVLWAENSFDQWWVVNVYSHTTFLQKGNENGV